MMKKRYGKLVRDKIPELLRSGGDFPSSRSMDTDEFRRELLYRLIEDAEIARQDGYDPDNPELVEKLADVQEVLNAILDEFNIGAEAFEKARQKRLKERGGFKNKTFLESVQHE
jgi:predicted house-cleaning noncanonical NTP pyrophosphatase (MazG superfamily)